MSTNVSISINATMSLIDAMTMPPVEIPLVATHECNTGFVGGGFERADINECDDNTCDASATCSNSIGSFSCACN